ncbi:MAG: hypothetical protein ACR2JW_05350 [Thermomicrobiales bacterium]
MSATTETIGQELTPTRMIVDWLTDAPDEIAAMHTKGAVRAWVDETTDARSDAGEQVSPDELSEVQEYLDKRVKRDGNLRWLREDLTKYATQFAPPEIGDIKAFVDWSLTQVDWAAVHDFIVSQRADAADVAAS